MAGRSAAARGAVGQALNVALQQTQHEVRDGATVALAVRLAAAVDAAGDAKTIGDLSGRLLPVLTALRMTPAARVVAASAPADAVKGGERDDSEPGLSPAAAGITQLRARARQRRAAPVDATSS